MVRTQSLSPTSTLKLPIEALSAFSGNGLTNSVSTDLDGTSNVNGESVACVIKTDAIVINATHNKQIKIAQKAG